MRERADPEAMSPQLSGTTQTSPVTASSSHSPGPACAVELWRRLHGARPDLLFVFSGFWKGKNGKGELLNRAQRTFAPDQLDEAAAWCAAEDRNGREVYFSVAQVFAPRRLAEYAAPTRVVHADLDGELPESWPIIPPTVIVKSGRGHHLYWVLDHYIQPDKARDLNRRIVRQIGADKAAIDAVRLMRVPGTTNRKWRDWTRVELLSMDDNNVCLDALEAVLPLPEPPPPLPRATPALSDDDGELLDQLGPLFRRLYDGDIPEGKYRHPDGTVDGSDVDSGLIRDLLRATGDDAERTERLMRASAWGATRNGKWDAGQRNVLRYSIDRLITRPSPPPAVRIGGAPNDAPPSAEQHCPGGDACPNRQRAEQFFQQIQLINQVLQLNIPPIARLTILWLSILVGLAQSRGQSSVKTSAKQAGSALWLSAQSIRPIFHGLARNDFTLPTDVFRSEYGLFDLDSDRVPEGGPFCRVFDIAFCTSGAYNGWLAAAVTNAPLLFPAPAKRTRQPAEPVPLPPDVVTIPTCPSHLMDSTEVHTDITCADCGEDFVRIQRIENRYVPGRQNANPYRFEQGPPPAVGIRVVSDTSHRFEPAPQDLERLARIYERGTA